MGLMPLIAGGGALLDFFGQKRAQKQANIQRQREFERQMWQYQQEKQQQNLDRQQNIFRQDQEFARQDANTAAQNSREDGMIEANWAREDANNAANVARDDRYISSQNAREDRMLADANAREDARLATLDRRADEDAANARNNQAEMVGLAKSAKTDAYGNTVRYVEGQGFVTDLTPLQQAIIDTQQQEQYQQLSEDAPRQRAASERKDARSKNADASFEKLMREYEGLNRPTQKSEESQSILRAMEERKSGPQSGAFLNQALRTGVVPRTQDRGTTLTAAIMDAKERGGKNWIEKDKAMTGKVLNEAEYFRSIANDTDMGPASVDTQSNQSGNLAATQTNAMSSLVQALQSGAATSRGNGGMVSRAGASGGARPSVTSNVSGGSVGNNHVQSRDVSLPNITLPNMPQSPQFDNSQAPIFSQLSGILAKTLQQQQQAKTTSDAQAREQVVQDRNYGLDYYRTTGGWPT